MEKRRTLLLNKTKTIKKEKTNEIIRSNSGSIEHSRLFLLNKMNLTKDYDKISYFNKKNLSKISDFKLNYIKKVPENSSYMKKSFKSESEDEKE